MEKAKEMKGMIGLEAEMLCNPYWAFAEDQNPDVVVTIENGDLLTIFSDAAEQVVRWSGVVDLDPSVTSATLLRYDRWGKPITNTITTGIGFQRGIAADEWVAMFCGESRRATLVKAAEAQPL